VLKFFEMGTITDFLSKYWPPDTVSANTETYASALGDLTRSSKTVEPFAGASFANGVYRLYDAEEIRNWTREVEAAFPDFRGRIRCFGRDWLCNQFCLHSDRRLGNESLVLLFEIGTGKVLNIPETLESFHTDLLVSDPEAALAESLYTRWRERNPLPLRHHECVGYQVPLFLGGLDDVVNLERTDADVYWTLTAQLLFESRAQPTNTAVESVVGPTKIHN
jgi:hypothetical protein